MGQGSAVVRSRRVVTPTGIAPAAIHIRAGRIERVAAWDDVPAAVPLDDLDELAILPGIVDTHVHLNEPGRTEWEGFATATRAAAIGGVTTLVDMPLNSIPPTTTREAFAAKRADADLIVFDDAASQTITPEAVHHRHKVTPYAGETLRGVVHATYLGGRRVAEGGRALATDLGTLL